MRSATPPLGPRFRALAIWRLSLGLLAGCAEAAARATTLKATRVGDQDILVQPPS